MARQNMGRRGVLVVALLGLSVPLLMGQGCCEGLWMLGLFGAGQLAEPRCPGLLNPLTVNAGNDSTATVGSNLQLAGTFTGGTAPHSIIWSPSAGLGNPDTLAPIFTPTAAGQYTFTLTITDAAGCAISDSLVVTVTAGDSGNGDGNGNGDGTGGNGNGDGSGQTAPLVLDAGPDRAATVGASVALQGFVSGGKEPLTIAWSPTNGLSGFNTLTPTFQANTTGSFTFTLKVTDAEGTVAEDSVVVTVSEKTTVGSVLWGADFAGGGYQLLVGYSKAVDKATAERLTSYLLSGTEAVPVSAVLGSDGKTVTLVFSGIKCTSKSEFDIAVGDGVLDTLGGPVPVIKGLAPLSNTADAKAPTVAAARWAVNYAGSYGLELVFSEAMDQATVENARAYRITDNGQSAVGFDAVLGDDARTVSLVFHGLALSVAAKIDVGLLSLRDINGRPLVPANGISVVANSLDLDPPRIVADSVQFVGNYAGGGYQVTLEFNEAMDRASAEGASAYKINGVAATSATLDNEGRKVTLWWASSTFSTGSKLSIQGGSVKDINGRALAAQNDLQILPAAGAGSLPSSPVLTWLKGTESTAFQFRARFNEAMDEESVEDTSNWAIAGTDIHPTSIVLSTQTGGEDIAGRTALVTFSNFGTSDQRMSRTTKVDVSIADSIKNVNGDAMLAATLAINANTGDVIPPKLDVPKTGLTAQPVWGDVIGTGYSGSMYQVSLVFSETMDGASAMDPNNYYLVGMHPTSVKMDGTGRKVVLAFSTTYGPVGLADKLQILPNVRDINGHGVSTSPINILSDPADQTPPAAVALFWGVQRGPYQATVTFDEVMDAVSATTLSAYRLANFIPTEAQILSDGRTVNLTFGDALLVPTDELDIVGNVFDINGRAYDHSRDAVLPGAPIGLPLDDTMVPAVARAVWAVDSLDYRVLVTFDEALSMDMAANPAFYRVGMLTATSAQLQPGGTTVEVVFTGFNVMIPPFGLTSTLSVRSAAGPTGVTGVTDMHGNMATMSSSVSIKLNELDTLGVGLIFFPPPTAVWMPDVSLGMYSLRVTFANEVLDRLSAENIANYRITDSDPPINPFMATLAPADDLPNGVFAGRTVFLDFAEPLSAASMVDASVGGSVVDMNNNGIPEAAAIPVFADPADVTVPTIVGADPGPLQGEWTVLYSETMDWDTATAAESYLLTATTLDGPVEYAPTGVWLADDGMTAFVQFSYPNVPFENATLHIEGPTDINGNAVDAFEVVGDDTASPAVVSAVNDPATPEEWTITFSEAMDPASATVLTNYVINVTTTDDPPVEKTYSPTTVTLSADGITATVVFPTIPAGELPVAILHVEGAADLAGNAVVPFDQAVSSTEP